MNDQFEPGTGRAGAQPEVAPGRQVRPTNAFVEFSKRAIEQSIPERFEQQVETYGPRVALKTDGGELSYTDLNQQANRVARAILSRCGEKNELVALLLPHGAPTVVAMLGALKAGKGYVALDPAYPEARLAYILDDSQAQLIVASNASLPLAQALVENEERLLDIDGIAPDSPGDDLEMPISPDALAYVIYTSGSTGQPKGVVQNHRNVLHAIMKYTNVLHIGVNDRVSLLPSGSTSAAVSDIFGALLNGAGLFPFDVREMGTVELGDWLIQENITIYHSVPTVFRHLVASLSGAASFPALRLIKLGGEVTYRSDVESFQCNFSSRCLLYIALGTTEIHNIRYLFVDSETEIATDVVPVGYAFADTEILILDDSGARVDVGCTGEIAVKSEFLTPGYWRRPELTVRAFTPVEGGRTQRIYRTGDLGRLHPDGCLEVLGRKDFQIKIRGFRVELGEIEAVLRQQPGIRDTVVMARKDNPGETQLVAYCVRSADSPQPDGATLRETLWRRLPEYMIPSVFIYLDALPLTANGKVDRLALPAPDPTGPETARGYVAPRTPLEEVVTHIWSEVLGVEQLGVHDNFFELGGYSLLATQIISRIRTECGVELTLRSLFDRPTVARFVEDVVAARKAEPATAIRPIVPVSRNQHLPLSFSEERMWFLHQLEEGGAAYNVPSVYRLTGLLDSTALARSLNEIVKRHEILRTAFTLDEGELRRVIEPSLSLELPVIEIPAASHAEQENEIQRLATDHAKQSFDLSRPPLVRAALLRSTETEHVLLVTMHHIVSDAWSVGVLVRELVTLYGDHCKGRPSSLPDLPIQYADFTCWQRELLQGMELERQLAYWKQQLAGAPLVLDLPTDRPRPARQTFHGARVTSALPAALIDAMSTLSRGEGITEYMVLMTAFSALLHRYTGQEDILLGTPIANRHWLAVEVLIGTFVNSLVMRADLSGNPTLRELLARVREVTLQAYAHQDLPFERLVEALQPERDLSRSPVFQVMFTRQNVPVSWPELPELGLQRLLMDREAAQFDLTVSVRETPDKGQRVTFEYNTGLFDRETIVRMLGHFQTLVAGLVADPDQRLSDIPLLSDAERQQLLSEWNDTARDFPDNACLHQLIEAQCERTPDAVAVTCEDEQITYRELNERVGELARHLRSRGVSVETLVGICLERSVNMVVGLLGILTAGGAYVPLDADYPKERLAFVMEDAGLALLVTQKSRLEKLPVYGGPVVCLDGEWDETAIASSDITHDAAGPSNLAYVIYTSGSTGKPKGVMIPHRALVNLLYAFRRRTGLQESDSFLAATTISFDIAGLELFLPLIAGARLEVVGRDVAVDGDRLIEKLAASRATVMQATPATWHMLLEVGWNGDPRLRVLCGGEALPWQLASQLQARALCVENVYGPTETTIWSTAKRIDTPDEEISIGRPIDNTRLYILDERQQPVPIGVRGELHIGGVGLARGYLNRAELTSERFIPDPFSENPDSCLYKTGDQARYRADGDIEYLGRLDNQVKLRGFRIELGEIEAVLCEHPAVQEAVVSIREDTPGDERLAGYVVLDQASAVSAADLRNHLANDLPAYMLPSAFVFLESLPLTPNGKVDRRSLPAPVANAAEGGFVAPQGALESQLTDMWESLLGHSPIGVQDDFFELGGHSLLAVRVCRQLEKAFGKAVPVATLFQAPTVAQLAESLRREGWSPPGSLPVPLQRAGSRAPFFFLSGPRNHFGGRLGPDQPVYRVLYQDLEHSEQPFVRIEDMAGYSLKSMTSIQPRGPFYLGGHGLGGIVAFEVAHQLRRQGHQVAVLALCECLAPGANPRVTGTSIAYRLWQRVGYHFHRSRQIGLREEFSALLRNAKRTADSAGWRSPADSGAPTRQVYRAAAVEAFRHYVPKVYPGRITCVRCTEQVPWRNRDPLNGWGNLATDGVDKYEIPGTHTSIYNEPNVEVLASTLNAVLRKA